MNKTLNKKPHHRLPPLGMRIIKSAIAVFICLGIYLLRGQHGTPFYSAIAAILCMQTYMVNSKTAARNRIFGTFLGALFGCAALFVRLYLIAEVPLMVYYTLLSLLIIPLIYCTVLIHENAVSYFSCVVFLSISVSHITDASPYVFVLNRILDTIIGAGVALCINRIRLPHKKNNSLLFVMDMDDLMAEHTHHFLTPYSRFELDRMLQSGAKITLATNLTPATLQEPARGLPLKLPVIALSGAVLYDMSKNHYLKKYVMNHQDVLAIAQLFKEHQICSFITSVIQDVLLINYTELNNPVAQEIYDTLGISPYRNYIKKPINDLYETVYIMGVAPTSQIQPLAQAIEALPCLQPIRLAIIPHEKYSDYSFLRIYDKEATKAHMIQTLQDLYPSSDTFTYGVGCDFDVDMDLSDSNAVVKAIKHKYEPIGF